MSKKTKVQLFWKLRPFYRIVKPNAPNEWNNDGVIDAFGGVLHWDPRGRTGGRKLTYNEFLHLVRLHHLNPIRSRLYDRSI